MRILRNMLGFFLSLLLLSFMTFSLARLAPGDPLVSYYGDRAEKMSEQEKERSRERLGLNDSLMVQYGRWLEQAARGEFGLSFKYKRPAQDVMSGRIMNTFLLGGGGFVLVFVLSLGIGIFCALHEGSRFDRFMIRAGTVSACIPEFWLCLLLILVFSVTLRWLPSGTAYSTGHEYDGMDRLVHLILPVLVLVISHVWYYAGIVRNEMITELKKDYIVLCRANGFSTGQIVGKHALMNILPTYLSLMAVALPHIIGGTYVVEMVFSYPGLGMLAYESARYHDYNLLMLTVLFSGALIMAANLGVNALARRLDPKLDAEKVIRQSEGGWI